MGIPYLLCSLPTPRSASQWMAPNLITFLGLVSLGLHTALCFWFSPDLRQPLPAWLPIAGALVQFFYQTMDAIDGKQARRTGSSSPLGQLFDHGAGAPSRGHDAKQGLR